MLVDGDGSNQHGKLLRQSNGAGAGSSGEDGSAGTSTPHPVLVLPEVTDVADSKKGGLPRKGGFRSTFKCVCFPAFVSTEPCLIPGASPTGGAGLCDRLTEFGPTGVPCVLV
jgi:hypothetical protein